MKAAILAVGSELLTPLRSESNGLYLTGRLEELGFTVLSRTVVADDLACLTNAFRNALASADVVLSTGGLGPTEDDLTREAAAAALGRALRREERLVEELKARFARYLRAMPEVNLKQADLIEGATSVPNARGSAPGQWAEQDGRRVFLLPGPPGEMKGMFEEQVVPLLRQASSAVIRRRVLRLVGGESDVEQVVAPLYKTFDNPQTTILGGAGQVELHLTARGGSVEEAEDRIEALARGLRERLPGRIFTESGQDLAEVVAALLVERGLRLALAESCTGGLLAARLTDVPGSSRFLDRGYVTYGDAAKVALLGVPEPLLGAVGAVSEEVARAMAEGARRAAGADVGVGITGIAGPTGATPDKPVGLVFVATDGAAGTRVRRLNLPGDRARVREQAVVAALEMLRRGLLGHTHA